MAESSSTEQSSKNRYVYAIAAVSALGGMLFGYDIGVISGALLFIKDDFVLSTFLQGVVVSSLLVGAATGALVGGNISDRFGRRRLLILAAIVFGLGAIGSALSPSAILLIIARFVLGLAVGAASLTVPLYIAEMAPANVRGALVSLNQLMITVGILVAYLVNLAFAASGNWRWMLGLAIVPAMVLGIGIVFLPETPRWLISQHLVDRARSVLRRTRNEARVEDEIAEISAIEERERQEAQGWGELLQPWVRPMFVVGVGLAIIQQITGINTVIYFAPSILEATGFGASASILGTVGVGVVNVGMTIVAIMLIDRVGRRPLLLVGLIGMILSLGMLGLVNLLPSLSGVVGYAALACVTMYVASFAVSLGPIVWLMISEIYPLKVRGSAMSVATIALWLTNVVVAVTFLSMLQLLGNTFTFWMYALIGIAAWIFIYFLVPETKERSLEEIEADLRERASVT